MESEQGAQRSSHWGEFRAQVCTIKTRRLQNVSSYAVLKGKPHMDFWEKVKSGVSVSPFYVSFMSPHTHTHTLFTRDSITNPDLSYMVSFPGNPRISDALESLSTLLIYLGVCWLLSTGVKPVDYGGQLPTLDLKVYVMTVPKSRLGLGPSHNPKAATGK